MPCGGMDWPSFPMVRECQREALGEDAYVSNLHAHTGSGRRATPNCGNSQNRSADLR